MANYAEINESLVPAIGGGYSKNDFTDGAKRATRRTRAGAIRAVGFGNSVMRENCAAIITSTFATTLVDTAAGQTTIPVVSSTGFTNGNTVEMVLYDGTLFSSTITVTGNNLILATPLPKQLHGNIGGGQNIHKKFDSSSYGYLYPANAWLRIVNAQMGNCFNFVNIYGYGGANSTQMLVDFQTAVLDYMPQVCFLHVAENDIRDIGYNDGTLTLAQSKANILSMITQCQDAGITVVISTSLPSAAFDTTLTVQAFDALNAWIMSLNKASDGIIVMPVHTLWTDQTVITSRKPIGVSSLTYTDILLHPNALGAALLARDIFYPRLRYVFGQGYAENWPVGPAQIDDYSSNPKMSLYPPSGTTPVAGTVNSPITGTCPTLTTCAATISGITTSSFVSSSIADGLLQSWQIVWSHSAGTDSTGNTVIMRLFPVTCPAGTLVVGRAEVEIINPVNIHGYGLIIDFGNNQSARSINFATADTPLVTVLPSGRFVLETVPMLAPASGAGTARLYFSMIPKAGVSTAGATMIWHRSSIAKIT